MHGRRNILSTLLLVFWEPKDRADEKIHQPYLLETLFSMGILYLLL